MFDKSITSDDKFLEMPIGSQLLYFHLSMNADDDGFINNWKSVMKMIGAKEDDLKILIAKSYVIPFETGVIVIKHWKINNYLRNDRYKPTRFQKEYNQLTLDNSSVYQVDTNGIPSIDKNSIDKNSIDKITDKKSKKVKHKYGEYGNVYFTDEQYEKLKKEFPDDYEKRIQNVDDYVQTTGKRYKDFLAVIRTWAKKEKNNNYYNRKEFKEMETDESW